MPTFTAIDFETANQKGSSICQVGLVRVEYGEVVKTVNQLVKPPDNFYSYYNIKVHGITPEDTLNAPTFEEIWGDIKPFIEGEILVAHNASFDVGCLTKTLAFYDLAEVKFKRECTYKIYKKGLAKICEEEGIKLKHHDALSDAMACAELFRRHVVKGKLF